MLIHLILLTAVSALMLVPGLLAGPSLDPAVFTQVAATLADGATPYAGAWDHKPPGIYLMLAGFQLALPFLPPWLITWLVSVAATAATGLALVAACRGIGISSSSALVASTAGVIGMSHYFVALGGGLTEPVAALPLTAALALALKTGATWTPRQLATVGLLLSLAVLVSLQAMVGAVAVVTILMARLAGAGRRMALSWLVAAGLVPLALVVVWLVLAGGFAAAIDALVNYNAAYRAVSADTGSGLGGAVVAWTLLSQLFLIVPAIQGGVSLARSPGLPRVAALAAAGWIVLSLGLFAVQGRFLAHYAIPLVVPLTLLAGASMDTLSERFGRAHRPSRRAVLVAPFAVVVLVSLSAAVAAGRMEWAPVARDHLKSMAVADVIREMTDADDGIWAWGNEPQLYLDAIRPQATPFAYLYPLVTQGYATQSLIDDVLADLAAAPPRLIIDVGAEAPGAAGFPHLIIPRPVATDGRDLDRLDPLREFVATNYELAGVVEGWPVYVLRLDGAAVAPRTGS